MDISKSTTKVKYGDDFKFDWTIEGSLNEIISLSGQPLIVSENLMSPESQNIWQLRIDSSTYHKRVHRKMAQFNDVKIKLKLIEHGHERPLDNRYTYKLKSTLTYETYEDDEGNSESTIPPASIEKSQNKLDVYLLNRGKDLTDMSITLYTLPDTFLKRMRNVHIKGRIQSEPQMINVNRFGDRTWKITKPDGGPNKEGVDRGGKILTQILNDHPEDIDVICNEAKFKIHKQLLTAQSRVFTRMFEVDLSEKQNHLIEIEEFEPETVHVFLNYLKNISNPEEIGQNVREIFMIAHKYEVDDLKTHCQTLLCKKIDIKNVVEMLEFAKLYELFELEDSAMKFILRKKRLLDIRKAFDRLAKENPGLWAAIQSEVWKKY